MTPRRKKPTARASGKALDFYAEALTAAERMRMPKARNVEGIDEEIALLRVRLFQHTQDHPDQLDMLLRGVGLLVRAVATKYRLSPKARKDLEASIKGVFDGVGRSLGLGEFSSAEEE